MSQRTCTLNKSTRPKRVRQSIRTLPSVPLEWEPTGDGETDRTIKTAQKILILFSTVVPTYSDKNAMTV